MFPKYFLALYFLAYIIAAFFWRSYLVKKRTGINPVTLKSSRSVRDFIGRVFKLLFATIAVVVIVFAFLPRYYHYLVPINWLEQEAVRWIGSVLLLLSLLWTVLAQSQMGESWRIGIDEKNRTPLVQRGVFRFSRNPIFLGMITTLGGLFLVIPNAITLLTLVLGVVVINVQVRLEEEHLKTLHGDDFVSYCRNVRRWI
jgi:protein-S-isoprenylcysteine O-methyltransferase Ste14